MGSDHSPTPRIPHEIAERWHITPLHYFDSAHNDHWLVESRGSRLVLRRYMKNSFDDIPYELEVMRRLQDLGWPIPEIVEGPMLIGGRTFCLFTFLPESPRSDANTPEERRRRGRLLAELHESTVPFTDMGQRQGIGLSDEVVSEPELGPAIVEYGKIYPDEGHVLRWHLERPYGSSRRSILERLSPLSYTATSPPGISSMKATRSLAVSISRQPT